MIEAWSIFCQWVEVQKVIPGPLSFAVDCHQRRVGIVWVRYVMPGFLRIHRKWSVHKSGVRKHVRFRAGYSRGYKSLKCLLKKELY